jgi:KTSC domain
MQRRAVESTTMRSIGYDETSQVLEVEFQSGMIYQYLDIPPVICRELLGAASKGRYFNSEIRDTYEFVRVDRRGRRGASAH